MVNVGLSSTRNSDGDVNSIEVNMLNDRIILNKYLMDTCYALNESNDLDKAWYLIHKKNES
jgi:hypothetical protein